MPIYEYYCAKCHGRFNHLARRVDASPPPCPRCGNSEVERMITAARLVHSAPHHEQQLRQASQQVDAEDSQAIAKFLKDSGRLADAEGVYGSKAYQELIARRAAGATEQEVEDLVEDLVTEMQGSDASKMAGALVFSDEVENRMLADGPHEDHEHAPAEEDSTSSTSRKQADALGWG